MMKRQLLILFIGVVLWTIHLQSWAVDVYRPFDAQPPSAYFQQSNMTSPMATPPVASMSPLRAGDNIDDDDWLPDDWDDPFQEQDHSQWPEDWDDPFKTPIGDVPCIWGLMLIAAYAIGTSCKLHLKKRNN